RNTVAETALALSRTQAKINRRATRRRVLQFSRYAAAVLLLVSLSIFGWMQLSAEKYTAITVSENESIKKIELSDGSTVWLSASSELQVPESFSPSGRKIALKGMAYFDVKKNPESPFMVTTPYMNVKVTGTSFNLSVDDENQQVETILVSGKVVLLNNRGKDVFKMSPGEKVLYTAKSNNYTVSTVNVNTFTSWHLDQITFENATLREIADKLSLIYDVHINLESKRLADRRYRYVINRGETLEEVLDILSYLAPIQYRIEENEVFITE
ncbi:MAG: FecR domain-containing protein, partial [Proteiniphilum sp.]|nr:FecR domain-containing protein [Proteiniphilum sp.]